MLIGNNEKLSSQVRQIEASAWVSNDTHVLATITGKNIDIRNASPYRKAEIQLSSETISDFSKVNVEYGKNLFNVNAVANAGSAVVNNGDGTLTITAPQAGAGVGFNQTLKELAPGLIVGEQYVLSYETTGNHKYIYLYEKAQVWSVGEVKTMTQEILDSRVGYYTGDVLVATISNFQIEKGSTATEYEPYAEYPIPVEVKRIGSNHLPYPYSDTTIHRNGVDFVDNGDGSITINGTTQYDWTTFMFHRNPSETIRLIDGVTYAVGGAGWNFGVIDFVFAYTNETGTTKWCSAGTSFTWSDAYTLTHCYIQIPNKGTVIDNITIYPQIGLGKIPGAFEPYQEQTATADENGFVGGLTLLPGRNFIYSESDVSLSVKYYQEQKGASFGIKHDTYLREITLERLGESKFFGFGVSHKANIKAQNHFDYLAGANVKIKFDGVAAAPLLYITEVHQDENTGEASITMYDKLYEASQHTVSELDITSYTIGEFAVACAHCLGIEARIPNLSEFDLEYPEGANFDVRDTIREALNMIAEATQTIYYINTNNELEFKRLDKDGEAVFTIDKNQYFTLSTKTNRRLTGIVSATQLGDNLEANTGITGTTQYVWDNAFWDLREDRHMLVEAALAAMENFTIAQFDCSWRGNYLVEPGDKIALITKDDETVYSFLVNDTLTYNGALAQKTEWEYTDEETELNNPTDLGDALKRTFAKVDKANQQIELVVSNTSETFDNINGELQDINTKVSATMTKDDFEILFSEKISNGVSSVETTTGFTFNEEGLTVSKSESDFSTTITEDGMIIEKGNKEVLTANNEGVKAIDLHATTYLIVGKYSRFENYVGKKRTACYWIG